MICAVDNVIPVLEQLQSILALLFDHMVAISPQWEPHRYILALRAAFLSDKVYDDFDCLLRVAWLRSIFFR